VAQITFHLRHRRGLQPVRLSCRWRRRAILLTSNRSIGEWGAVFGDPVVATAILDRLLHHSHVITIRDDSYRLKEKRRSGLLQKPTAVEAKSEKKAASRSLATALLEGALARGLLHIGKDHGGQFLMSPGEQFRMSLDREVTSSTLKASFDKLLRAVSCFPDLRVGKGSTTAQVIFVACPFPVYEGAHLDRRRFRR
jgi:IstB-like ATP binding protein